MTTIVINVVRQYFFASGQQLKSEGKYFPVMTTGNKVLANVLSLTDWLRRNVYWIDGTKAAVEVVREDGAFRTELLKAMPHLTSITLAPLLGSVSGVERKV